MKYSKGLHIKLLFINLLLCFVINAKTDFNQFPKESNHKLEIKSLQKLIISNPDLARTKIDDLLLENGHDKHSEKWMDYEILKIELYRFLGDYFHMKIELFNALNNVNPKTTIHQKLLLEYYDCINDLIKGKVQKHFNGLMTLLKKSKKYNFPYIEATVYSTLGKYYFEKNQFDIGRKYLKKAAKIFIQIKDEYSLLIVNIRDGIGHFWEGNHKQALTVFHSCLNYCVKNNLKINQYYLIVNIGETHLFSNQLDSAKIYYYKFINNKIDADIRDVYQAYIGLEHYYNQVKNVDSAYRYCILQHQIDDSLKNNINQNLSDEIEKSFEREQSQKLINKKNTEIKNIKRTNKLILSFLILGSVFILFIITMILYAYRTKNRLNKKLMEQQRSIIEKNQFIDNALKEKVILLKEIHHRVKNNLQIISSLLNLQTRNVTDETALSILEEGKERIQAIALIHQKLYQNDSFEAIEMEGYITELTEQLHKTYINSEKHIEIEINAKNVFLNLDTAVPLGLILCELITNAFKHAFSAKLEGKVSISLYAKKSDNSYILEIQDNGVGFDASHVDNGLGSEIVDALTEQLEGEKTIFSDKNGSLTKIHFKKLAD